MANGTLTSFDPDKPRGSISPTDGSPDLIAHFTDTTRGKEIPNLHEGQQVQFNRERGQKGPEAVNVRPA